MQQASRQPVTMTKKTALVPLVKKPKLQPQSQSTLASMKSTMLPLVPRRLIGTPIKQERITIRPALPSPKQAKKQPTKTMAVIKEGLRKLKQPNESVKTPKSGKNAALAIYNKQYRGITSDNSNPLNGKRHQLCGLSLVYQDLHELRQRKTPDLETGPAHESKPSQRCLWSTKHASFLPSRRMPRHLHVSHVNIRLS